MTIAAKTVESLLYLTNTHYPDWSGFDDPRFLEEEIEYKKETSKLARDLLSEKEFQRLLENGEYDEIIQRLDTVGQDNNLLWRSVPTSGDLNILYQEDLDKEAFVKAIFQLLHGNKTPKELLQTYSDFIKQHDWPNKWTFPTYFRFLLHPKTDFFVKPRATKWYLDTLGSNIKLGSDPQEDVYREIIQKTSELKEQLEEYGPEDMIDIQSLLWTAYRVDETLAEELSHPFSILFSNRREAEWAFELLRESAEHLGIQGPDDPLASFTLRQAGKKYFLRLIYGNCLMVGFSAVEGEYRSIALALVDYPKGVQVKEKQDFSVQEGEIKISIFWFDFKDVYENQEEFQKHLIQSQELIHSRFAHWKASPFWNHQVDVLAEAVFDEQKKQQLFKLGVKPLQQSYWKISPGSNAWHWENCLKGGFIAVGWDGMGDLSGLSRSEFEKTRENYFESSHSSNEKGLEQLWKFSQIKDGDRIVANRGATEVLGIGTVTGPYYYEEGETHSHRLPVNWDEVELRKVDQPGWQKTLIELSKDEFETILEKPIESQTDKEDSPFSEKAFDLLKGIHKDPTKEYYDQHKEDFKSYVKDPFQKLMTEIAERLPEPIKDQMETEKWLFSRFLKNDFGQGGAWSHYWGAFYPESSKRTEDAQLVLVIKHSFLEAGFFIGDYASEQRERFSRNCQRYYQSLISLFKDKMNAEELTFGQYHRESVEIEEYGGREHPDWKTWLKNPGAWDYNVSVIFPKSLVLNLSQEELIERISKIYTNLFPLVLLTVSDDPLPLIRDYLGEGREEQKTNPVYSLKECSQKTHFKEEQLARWIRAIRRKKQAIFYGPPGTGKTFLADHLADHLIGGGNGFKEIVQFHPSYAYEDFMQGIRPKTAPDGKSLLYELEKGRFLQFCEEAKRRDGKSVLIIDEINRANLSRVFGELMYLLEYRKQGIPLSGGRSFSIPDNVYIIGTMNTADRSIALVDHALRRRFAFLALGPHYEVLEKFYQGRSFSPTGLVEVLKELNDHIGDKNYAVGISFFMVKEDEKARDHMPDIWQMEIEPYLEEYFFDQQDKVERFRWTKVKDQILNE
jgi:5-methylcytosine-specific restriction protein B